MLKVANSVINASRITGVLPVVNGGTGVTTSTGTGNTVLSASPTLSGDVAMSTGNLVISTAGKGIDFSATASSSGTMTSELLADYEEGTFTPSVTSAVGTITTVGATSGTYTKVGRLCTLTFDIAITVNGTGASSIRISNNPFTSLKSANGSGSEVNSTGKMINPSSLEATTDIYFAYYDATYPGADGTRFKGTITYPV